MALTLLENIRLSAEAAARVKIHLLSGPSAPAALLDELATLQYKCLAALHARLRQKASILGLTPAFITRIPSQAFVSDFSDTDQCLLYAAKRCEECSTAEQMRQLVPILRCLQSDAPNSAALLPLFVKMGGLVAVLEWAKRTAAQLKASPDSHSLSVLIGVLQVVSKFYVLPKQTVPIGACALLLDIMHCRLPQISACVRAVLQCWMKCAERSELRTGTKERRAIGSVSQALKPKFAAPVLPGNTLSAPVARGSAAVVVTSKARSADLGLSRSKLIAELCDDEADVSEGAPPSKRQAYDATSRLAVPSSRPPPTACNAPPPSRLSPAPHMPSVRQSSAFASGSSIPSLQLDSFSTSCHDSASRTDRSLSDAAPASFDTCAAVQALNSLAAIMQQDSPSMVTLGVLAHDAQQNQAYTHHESSAVVNHNFAELFAPPALHDSDFFYSDEQFYADDVTMSSDAINRAFIEALQQFNQRDELSGLQSLCAKFHT